MNARLDRLRVAVAVAWVVAASGLALAVLGALQPLSRWIVFEYAGFWAATGIWAVACLAIGLRLLRALDLAPPLGERLVLGAALGVLTFGLAIYAIGLAHGLHAVTFFALPAGFIAIGARDLARAFAGVRRILRATGWRRPGPLVVAASVFGLLALALVYIEVLSPGNLAYDARWYHLGLAEEFAASGAVHRAPEGLFTASLPLLATYLYTWAFLMPFGSLFHRVELASHMEIALLVLTLASIGRLAGWFVRGRPIRGAWAALFLFPGIFVYDGNLNGGADHVLAAFAIPLALALRRFWADPGPRWGGLTAAFAAAAMLTKYQAMYVVIPAAALVAARGGEAALRAHAPGARRAALRSVGMAALVGGGLMATLWLKNWIWYGNPVFPLMHECFATHPWSIDATTSHDWTDPRWIPAGKGLAALGDTALETLRFGFRAHDWPGFHGEWPVAGFLFTLLWPVPLLLPGTPRRLRVASIALLVAVAIWYFTQHQDRYLQSLTPLLAAAVVATLCELWRVGRVARAAATALVAVQLAWAGGLLFLPTHAMLGRSALANAIEFLAGGFNAPSARRQMVDPSLEAVSKALPPRARVLLHGQHLRLGLEVPVVSDAPEQQSAFAYRAWRSPAEIARHLRKMGVTHVVWTPSPPLWGDWGSELAFFDFVSHSLVEHQSVEGYSVGRIPDQLPADNGDDAVEVQACRGRGQTTLLDLGAVLTSGAPMGAAEPSRPARFVVTEDRCPSAPPGPPFVRIAGRSGYTLWSRPLRP
jgi:hypothetical protein